MRTVALGAGCRARSVATTTAPPALTRRRMLRAATTVVALAALAACATGTGRTSSAPSAGATTGLGTRPDLVMVVRHGEKPDDSHPGVDANGNEDESSLTEIGWEPADWSTSSTRPRVSPGRGWPARWRSMRPVRTTTVKARGPAKPSHRWPTSSASR